MALGRDPALEFSRSLIDRYIQFKGLQFQQELLRRREDRYNLQLQENRLHRQRQMSMSQEHLDLRKRYVTAVEQDKLRSITNIPVFKGSEREYLSEAAQNALYGIEVEETGGTLGFGKKRIISREAIQNRWEEYKDEIFYDTLKTEDERKARRTTFNRMVRHFGEDLKAEPDWPPPETTPETKPDKKVFKGATSSETAEYGKTLFNTYGKVLSGKKTGLPESISTDGKFDRAKFLAEVARIKAVDMESARRFFNMYSPLATE